MSLRKVFRSKIKDVLHGGDHQGHPPSTNNQEAAQQESEPTAIKSTLSPSVESSEMERVSDGTSSCHSSDMELYEIQLNQLQEHLVAAMLENQQLSRELKGFKESQEVVRLLGELESEKERNRQLEDELCETTRSNHSPSQLTVGDGTEKHGEFVERGVQETDVSRHSCGWRERVTDWITHVFCDVISDFTDDPEPVINRNTQDLTVKRLKESILRFKSATNPIFETVSNVSAMFSWRNPAFSFLAFLMYMYLVWTGYLLPFLLFLAIIRLGANNLRERGWNVNMMYLPSASPETPAKDSDEITSVSDKVTIVLQVAKTVQNTLSSIADNLEKINSLLTWKHPGASKYLVTGLCAALLLSAVLPATLFFRLAGLYLGIKLFIIDTMYGRFPRLRQHRDTVYKYWQQLPTERELDQDRLTAAGDVATPSGDSSQLLRQPSDDGRTFCESFFLPLNEKPIAEWRSGWRCIHIDREKSLTAAIKPGKLYLTHSFLCFARHNPQTTTNIKIRLADITRIKKVKPYAWMPGKGKSIEITVIDCEKRYLFGAIFGRDDCYKSIMFHGRETNLPWAIDDPNTTSVSTWSSRTPRHKASESVSVSARSYRLSELQSEDEQEQKDTDRKDDDDSLFDIGSEL